MQILIQWDDPHSRGNIPARLFEQIALTRPILRPGPANGEPVRILSARKAGFVSTDAAAIAGTLRAWLRVRHASERLPDPPAKARVEFEHTRQYERLAKMLERLISRARKAAWKGPA